MAMNGVDELVASWLTPTVLFCVMNLMIGTIFFRSSLKTPRTKQQRKDDLPPHSPRQLDPVPSFFKRVKSFNMSSYEAQQSDPVQEPPRSKQQHDDDHSPRQLGPAPSFFERVDSFNMSSYETQQPDPVQEPPHSRQQHGDDQSPRQLGAAPSFSFFQRVKSFNMSSYEAQQPDPVQEPQRHLGPVSSFFERVKSFNILRDDETQESDPVHHAVAAQEPAVRHEIAEPHHVRTKSDAVVKAAPAVKMLLKSASEKVVTEEEEEEDEERWRPATARPAGDDDEVDGKADDFINKFRQQLKLQRLDSLVRYNDMINRGSGRWR